MSKMIIIKVDSCRDCDFCDKLYESDACRYDWRDIELKDLDTIPDDCPLVDWEDK